MNNPRTVSTSYSTATTSRRNSGWATAPSRRLSTTEGAGYAGTLLSRPRTGGRRSTGKPSTAGRPRTGYSTLAGIEDQEIICAVSESRGVSPTVGLAFVNLDTGEAVLSQINDTQTYVRTVYKLGVFEPSNLLIVSTTANPPSKLFSVIEESLSEAMPNTVITLLDRRYWAEATGLDYIQQLAFADECEAIKTAVNGKYYAVCCFAAALKYAELGMGRTFLPRALRIKYEPSEGCMMIDFATIRSLELVQNLQYAKSRDCLLGLLNETLTPMGSRLLRSNILQPLTSVETLQRRYDAVEELSTKEELFVAVRQALKAFLDADRTLIQLIRIPTQISLRATEQATNNILMLKKFVTSIRPVWEALTNTRSSLLMEIRDLCSFEKINPALVLINSVINEDTTYATQALDLSHQRTYAVKSGVNGLLDVARQTYKESMEDALNHIADVSAAHQLPFQSKFDSVRHFYLRLKASALEHRNLPETFINVYRRKDMIECQTLDLVKRNQKIGDSHNEVLLMSDRSIQDLIANVRGHMSRLFRVCEGIAMLDMLCSFAQVSINQDYVRPSLGQTLAIHAGRHPIREKIRRKFTFVPNDVYATQQTRFQVITGCNMSGKSTYIRSIALTTVMAQAGSFVPAAYASLPIIRQLFARVSTDDNVEANVSTFAAEMRETAFILRNIDEHSMAIIDELGRGTSTRDGLAIALAIAEALVSSRALVWFATHFRDLAHIMAARNGVVALHLAVNMRTHANARPGEAEASMEMLHRITPGTVEERHYGLRLAKVLPLPADVLAYAEQVTATLEQRATRHQGGGHASHADRASQATLVMARRRKLLLHLKEHLHQARDSHEMDDAALGQWLKDLQQEFVLRMTALDDEARALEEVSGGGEDVEDGGDITGACGDLLSS